MPRISGTQSPQNKPGCHTRRRPKSKKKTATRALAWVAAFIIVCFCSFKRFFAHSRYLYTASGQRKRFLHPTVTARKKDSHTRRRPKSKKKTQLAYLAWVAAFIIGCGFCHSLRSGIYRAIYRTHIAKKTAREDIPQADYLYLRFVVELLDLIVRLAGQVDAELAVDIRVDLGEYNRGVCLAAAQE